MQPLSSLSSRVAVLPIDNIDTDQIIPARFLTTIDKQGLGKHLFSGWRYDTAGQARPEFILNRPTAQGAQILLAGDNFGCGSSREHAPWALLDYGFRVVISTSFADIFRNNALRNGLLPVVLDAKAHRRLLGALAADPATVCTVDLPQQRLTLPNGASFGFPIDSYNKTCLLQGVDELGYLLSLEDSIRRYEASHPARVDAHAAMAASRS